MSGGILIGLATEWVGLHHRNETRLDLEIFSSGVNLGPDGDLVSMERSNHGVSSGPVTPGFKDKTECITICMPGSSFIHIEIL